MELFESVKLNARGRTQSLLITGAFNVLLAALNEICPSGREFSIVKTKLEEASFFARKAMASDTKNQEI